MNEEVGVQAVFAESLKNIRMDVMERKTWMELTDGSRRDGVLTQKAKRGALTSPACNWCGKFTA